MKRTLTLVLTLTLMLCGAAPAEAPFREDGTAIGESPLSLDLDGDGAMETVCLETVPDDFESFQRLRVVGPGGAEAVYDAEIISGGAAWACDLDRDGAMEIFLWGDIMSDDYYTWCLRYSGDHLAPALFADISRGENGQGYFKSGYGALEDVNFEDGTVTLSGSQDVLGTYFMGRTLKLTGDGLFEVADDGLWVRDVSGFDDDAWEYGALTVKAPIPCEIDGEAAVLEPGERLMITGTDKDSVATFLTRDGRAGALAIGENYMQGWGSLVDGIPEEDAFEYLPYAD